MVLSRDYKKKKKMLQEHYKFNNFETKKKYIGLRRKMFSAIS